MDLTVRRNLGGQACIINNGNTLAVFIACLPNKAPSEANVINFADINLVYLLFGRMVAIRIAKLQI